MAPGVMSKACSDLYLRLIIEWPLEGRVRLILICVCMVSEVNNRMAPGGTSKAV